METLELLDKALAKLDAMSPEEVQEVSSVRGIVVPEEPDLSDWLDDFIVDLSGSFSDIVNCEINRKWIQRDFLDRKNILIDNNEEPQETAALSF